MIRIFLILIIGIMLFHFGVPTTGFITIDYILLTDSHGQDIVGL